MTTTQSRVGPVTLDESQQALFDELDSQFKQVMSYIHSRRGVTQEDIKKLGAKAAELHKSLSDAGIQVRHHKYMIQNRGTSPGSPEFYEHVHPVEDLIKFIRDQAANTDPEDQTIGHKFDFVIYSRRWKHTDTYEVERTRTGWAFGHLDGAISTGKDARVRGENNTGLFRLLDHDLINYPEELPGYFAWLWVRAAEDGLTHEQTQDALNLLADWVTIVEKQSPSGIFKDFK